MTTMAMVTISAMRLKMSETVADVGKMKDWLGSPMTHATHKLVRTAFNLKNRLSSSVTGSLVRWIRWEESRRMERLRENFTKMLFIQDHLKLARLVFVVCLQKKMQDTRKKERLKMQLPKE